MLMQDTEKLVEEFLLALPCRDESPYPDVRVPQNKHYAQLLLDAFADGSAAELTAVGQCIQHHLTIKNRDIANLELCIALAGENRA